MMTADEQGSSAPLLLSIDQAARHLGVTGLTVRRQIKAGKLKARRIRGKFGPEWRVCIEQPMAPVQADEEGRIAQPRADDDQPISALIALVEKLQDENRRLQDDRFELAGRLGFFQAELESTRKQLAILQAPAEPEKKSENSGAEKSQPWWRLW